MNGAVLFRMARPEKEREREESLSDIALLRVKGSRLIAVAKVESDQSGQHERPMWS